MMFPIGKFHELVHHSEDLNGVLKPSREFLLPFIRGQSIKK